MVFSKHILLGVGRIRNIFSNQNVLIENYKVFPNGVGIFHSIQAS